MLKDSAWSPRDWQSFVETMSSGWAIDCTQPVVWVLRGVEDPPRARFEKRVRLVCRYTSSAVPGKQDEELLSYASSGGADEQRS